MVRRRGVQITELPTQALNPVPPHILDQFGHLRRNLLPVEPEELVGVLAGQTLAERRHAVPGVGVALPPVDSVRLDDDAGRVGAVPQCLALVLGRLGLEEALAGEGDDARLDAEFLGEDLAGLDGKGHLGADADEGDVGVGLLDEDVGAPEDTIAARVLGELLEVLAGEGDDGGAVGGLEGGDEGAGRLLAVAGADVEDVGHGAVEGGQGDGLVGWAVLAGADGVVGGDVDLLEVLEGAHADTGGGVL